jgi:hypothetical protein
MVSRPAGFAAGTVHDKSCNSSVAVLQRFCCRSISPMKRRRAGGKNVAGAGVQAEFCSNLEGPVATPRQNPSLRPRRRIRSRAKPSLSPVPAENQANTTS